MWALHSVLGVKYEVRMLCAAYMRGDFTYYKYEEVSPWSLRCEDSSNFFKTPKKVQCCQTRKLKSLIKLVVISDFSK